MSTLISIEGGVSIVGVNVGLEGMTVMVDSTDDVTEMVVNVNVRGKPVRVAVMGGGRITGVAV